MTIQAEVDSHTLAIRSSVAQIAGELENVLGQRLTAVIAGVSDAKAITKWARGERAPRPDAEQHLRDAHYITHLLVQAERPSTIRAWFSGMNPKLDDRAPRASGGPHVPCTRLMPVALATLLRDRRFSPRRPPTVSTDDKSESSCAAASAQASRPTFHRRFGSW